MRVQQFLHIRLAFTIGESLRLQTTFGLTLLSESISNQQKILRWNRYIFTLVGIRTDLGVLQATDQNPANHPVSNRTCANKAEPLESQTVVASRSVHTGRKQHQRICWQICVLASSVDWASTSDSHFCVPAWTRILDPRLGSMRADRKTRLM